MYGFWILNPVASILYPKAISTWAARQAGHLNEMALLLLQRQSIHKVRAPAPQSASQLGRQAGKRKIPGGQGWEMGAKWKTRSPAFSTRTHTKGLAEITYTPRAPLGPQNESNEKKTFSSHEMRRKKPR